MFGKVIVFGLFEMIKKKKSEDLVLGFGFGLWVESGTAALAITTLCYGFFTCCYSICSFLILVVEVRVVDSCPLV